MGANGSENGFSYYSLDFIDGRAGRDVDMSS